MKSYYERTIVGDSSFTQLDPVVRKRLIYGIWAVAQAGLIAGYFDRAYWGYTILYCIGNALLFLGLVGMKPLAFPAQLRIAYVGWLTVGTYVPHMTWMMYVTTAGLAANLLFGYCPLSRLLTLLPFNRPDRLDWRGLWRIFFSPPMQGRFQLVSQ